MHEIRAAVLHLLWKYGIHTETWGTGATKTIEHLIDEVARKESILIEQDGSLFRLTFTVALNVYYPNERQLLVLTEAMQVFADGRIRRRELDTSIGEKMSLHEPPHNAAYRALREELGIHARLPLMAQFPYLKGPHDSTSFPGLQSIHQIYLFEAVIPSDYYEADGYVEEQSDKTSYFVWKEVRFD